MTAASGDRSPAALARALVDAGEALPAVMTQEILCAVAWALKDLCYAAWSSEPQRAARVAATLRDSCAGRGAPDVSVERSREIDALADWTEGIAHVTRGDMAEAAHCFDRAADAFRSLGETHHAAQTQVPKIMALSMLGQHAEAAACAERSQRELVAHGDLHAASKVSLNLGSSYLRRDAYPQAARHYREAAVLFARVDDREHSVMADIGMADAFTSMGDFAEALRIYARARMRARTHGYPVLEALVEESVALLELARGNFREALAGFEGSRRQYEQLAMPQHRAIAEKQLADAYLELRLLPEAIALFDQAFRQFQALDMRDDQAWTLAQCGRTQALLGRPTEAAATLSRAAALFAEQSNHVGVSAVALARAGLALTAGDISAALPLAEQAAAGFDAARLANGRARADVVAAYALLHADRIDEARARFDVTLKRAEQLGLLPVQVQCLTGRGLTAQAAHDMAAARGAFTAAVELFEEQRRTLPGDDIRGAFLSDHLRPYQELLRIALIDHERNPSPQLACEVLQHLDRFRARALGERLAQPTTPEDSASTRDMRARLNWLYRRAQRMEDEGEISETFIGEIRRAERELLEHARRQRLAGSAIETAARVDDDFRATKLLTLLDESDALVEYGVLDRELFACVATRAGVILRRNVADWPDVLDAARSARFQIETLRHGAAPVLRHMATLTERMLARMRRLHALVWEPVADALDGCRRVLVVPHAQLGSLPFAALHDGKQPLALRYDLAMAPSARLAVRGLIQRPSPARSALVLGNSARLPHAAQEAQFVASLFPQTGSFVGAQATLEALRINAGSADVIHLACHGQFRSDNPMFSALHLYDGAVTAEWVETLQLRPAIVVLSACETGLADAGSGDEMIGLVRAFIVAGGARVLASLWPVDDAVTGQFMKEFYGVLREGCTPAAALRHAQGAVMRQYAHPFYWAAFALQGGW